MRKRYAFLLVQNLLIAIIAIGFVDAKAATQIEYCGDGDIGAFLYLNHPDSLMRGIRVAEGVPSYGVLYLAEKYGTHNRVPASEGRRAAAWIVHEQYRRWRVMGCPGTYLGFLGSTFAPVGARNDPFGLNKNWQENVLVNAAMHAERSGR